MKEFNIHPIARTIEADIKDKIDNLTKPKGSLGRLEEIAEQICLIQQTLNPTLRQPHNVLFAGDHGIIEEGVSVSPKEVTWQQLSHFSKGGAGINFLCDQHGFKLILVDAGVDYDIPSGHGIIDMKVGRGTRNFLHGPAMTEEDLTLCIERGSKTVEEIHGATSSASEKWEAATLHPQQYGCIFSPEYHWKNASVPEPDWTTPGYDTNMKCCQRR